MSDYSTTYSGSYLLAVGINSYQSPHFSPLGNAEADAQAVADILSKQPYNFTAYTLIGEQATRAAVVSMLDEMEQTQPDDRIVIYFSGHGYTLTDNFNHETGYLACVDTQPEKHRTALKMEEVTGLRAHAPAKHIAFIFDACFSGQALGLTKATTVAASVDEFLRRRSYQVISAGAPDQTVSDFQSMTGAMLDVLSNPDELITLDTLGLHLKQTIPAISRGMQIPQYGQLTGSQGGDVVFYVPPDRQPIDLLPKQLRLDLLDENPRLRYRTVSDTRRFLEDPEYAVYMRQVLEDMLYTDPSEDVRRRVGEVLQAAGERSTRQTQSNRRKRGLKSSDRSGNLPVDGEAKTTIDKVRVYLEKAFRRWRLVGAIVVAYLLLIAWNIEDLARCCGSTYVSHYYLWIFLAIPVGLVARSHWMERRKARAAFFALITPAILIAAIGLSLQGRESFPRYAALAAFFAGIVGLIWAIVDAIRNKYV